MMIRSFSLLFVAGALGLALCCASPAAPAFAKDKPAAEDPAEGAKADKKKIDKKKPAKADAKQAEVKKTETGKPEAKKPVDAKKTAEGKKTDAKKPSAGKPEAEESEPSTGKDAKHSKGKPAKDAKGESKDKPADKDKGAAKPPAAVGTFGDWNAMTAHGQGKDKTCYALAEPKDRQPAKLPRDKAYIFISTRPGEGVRNELAIILGFPLKDGGAATAEIDGDAYELVTKGTNAWVKNPAKEKEFVEALRNGSKLVVKAPSIKGNVTTDIYSLKGLSEALARVQKECP
jgi:hypothetical protein